MFKFALEMLWTERKKAYGLVVSIVTTLSICLLFLHFMFNPFLAKKLVIQILKLLVNLIALC